VTGARLCVRSTPATAARMEECSTNSKSARVPWLLRLVFDTAVSPFADRRVAVVEIRFVGTNCHRPKPLGSAFARHKALPEPENLQYWRRFKE
jgi:hypothetical protein